MKFIKSYLPLIVVLVCLTKIAIAQEITFASSLALLVAMLGYGFHSYLDAMASELFVALQNDVNSLRNEIHDIRSEVIAFKPIQDQVAKSAEDIKKVISTTNLGSAIYQRTRLKRDLGT